MAEWKGLTPSAGAPSSRSGDSATERDGVQAGYSLTDAVAKIDELERAEFDLKLRLYYTEERLEEAAGGASAAYLHQEIANAKRVCPFPSEVIYDLKKSMSQFACGDQVVDFLADTAGIGVLSVCQLRDRLFVLIAGRPGSHPKELDC